MKVGAEMSVDVEENLNCSELDKSRDPDRTREWFSVQLEVINLLLEAERRKLSVLQRELKTALEEGGSIKAKEHQKQELLAAIQKIQLQHDNLEKECRQHAIEALKASNTRGTGKVPAPAVGTGDAKPKPPVPPKRSTLTYGRSYASVGNGNLRDAFSPTGPPPSSEPFEEPRQPLTSHLVTVTTNILSTTPKGLPTPRAKNQRVLSTFLPALPPKFCKSPLAQSPNFSRTQISDEKKIADPEPSTETSVQKPERRTSEKDSTSPSSLSSARTQSSCASLPVDKDESDSAKPGAEISLKKDGEASEEFSPSQSPPDLPPSPSKSCEKSPPLPELPSAVPKSPESSPPDSTRIPIGQKRSVENADENVFGSTSEEKLDGGSDRVGYLDESGERTNTVKRAPASDRRNADAGKDRPTASGTKLRSKSPSRVSFAKEENGEEKIYEKLTRAKRATKELKNIIHQIEYSESEYCSDDSCRTCVTEKTSSLSYRRRSASPQNGFSNSADLLEGYTSCCEEGTVPLSKKTRSLTRRSTEEKNDVPCNRTFRSCPLDGLVVDNRIPLSRPNSSVGDYCTQPSRSKSGVRAKKNSGFGIKTPFWSGSSKIDFEKPGLSLIITISSDGIDKEPKRTVQFISGGPAVNFGLGGTLGRYTKSKSQDKTLKVSGNAFHADHCSSDFEDFSDRAKYSSKLKSEKEASRKSLIKEETHQEAVDCASRQFPALERQKSAGELRRPASKQSRAAEEHRQRYLDIFNGKKSPGEVLEHFGKLAASATTSEISKISDEKTKEENGAEQRFRGRPRTSERIFRSGNHHENYRTVPPASFNHPDPYGGSAFVQYVRETLPHQPNSFPVGAGESAFDKYVRPGSGKFDKSLFFPQNPKSDKPSAFERLCGDKIYASRRGIRSKSPAPNQGVSGSLDCVWGKPKAGEPPKANGAEDDPGAVKESRPASCTYEITKGRLSGAPTSGPYSNYASIPPASYGKERAASGIPRTSKKGILESEPSGGGAQQSKILAGQGPKPTPPQYFNPRSLENYKLAPGFKTDLSTLYSGVFYANPKRDGAPPKSSDGSRTPSDYGTKRFGLSGRSREEFGSEVGVDATGTGNSTARKAPAAAAVASAAAAARIPEEAAPGTTTAYPPQYHPTEEELMQENQSNRSQPAIGLKQTPKSRPSIFGTVTSDQVPKDGSSRRSLPQTTLGATNGGLADFGSGVENVKEAVSDEDDALVYRDGNLVSGSMEALIRHMVPTAEYYPDRAYLFAFLLSSRLFVKPHELLGQVCALCDSQQRLGGKDPPSKERLGRFIPHFVQLLAEWTETFPYDFRDERVMVHVRNVTQKCVAIDPSIRKEVSALLQNLLVRLTTLEKYEEFLVRISAENSTDSLEGLNPTDVTELCASPGLLAQQLTHIELERLSYIGPEEFVQAFAKENPDLGTSFKDMKKTRNLESYVSWFNRLSYLVATDVCKHAKKKQRVRVTEYWIETARECFNIGNFNSLMAVIAGLNMSPVARLKKTWSKIQSGKFSVLEHQMDPSSNFSSYRSTLKAAMWRSAGATDQRQRIVIPFFSLLVKDLYFLNEGCSNKLPNGHVNFEKFWQLAKQVTEFITWKQVACPFDKCTKVITFLQASPVLTENALALASFECEPPENNHEKERYKSLK